MLWEMCDLSQGVGVVDGDDLLPFRPSVAIALGSKDWDTKFRIERSVSGLDPPYSGACGIECARDGRIISRARGIEHWSQAVRVDREVQLLKVVLRLDMRVPEHPRKSSMNSDTLEDADCVSGARQEAGVETRAWKCKPAGVVI